MSLVERPVIDKAHVTSVCRPGERTKTCRYLILGPGGWRCALGSDLQSTIDGKVSRGEMVAISQNCDGWDVQIAERERE